MTAITTGSRAATLLEAFTRVRRLTDTLTRSLSPEDQTPQSMTEASPVKWHRAHTTWFFEEFVLGADPGYVFRNQDFRYLFNSYYEAVGQRHPRSERGLVTRPGVAEVAAYRSEIEDLVAAALADDRLDSAALDLIELGCHHEQQHQELLLMDLKHLFAGNAVDPVYVERAADRSPEASPAPVTWSRVPSGLTGIGHDGAGFAFDNERPRHRVWLEDVQLASRPVTNAEWVVFIEDGAYTQPALWLSDGWAKVHEFGWQAPAYWRRDADGQWTTFTLSGRRPVVMAEPVCHVSYLEAEAFARWAGARLPTEQEWEAFAAGRPRVDGGLLDPARCHPGTAHDTTLGEVWEWTSSAYLPYPGFATASGAVGEYNGKFMHDQHVLRGGCAITPVGHTRITYRNFYPAHLRWMYAGLRLAR